MNHNNKVIISAERTKYTDEINNERTNLLRDEINALGLTYSCLQGYWDGAMEKSSIVQLNSYSQMKDLLALAAKYDQDGILEVNADKYGYLVWANGKEEYLGELTYQTSADSLTGYSKTVDGRIFTFTKKEKVS